MADDGTPSGTRERMQRALAGLLYLPHLQAQRDEASLPVAAAPAPGAAAKGRPWDRGDLFRRLATFKSSTWFCKPVAIGPVECARRGWTNTGPDMLTCEFCRAKLSCPIPADLLPDEAAAAGATHAARLAATHDAACPWRTGSSSLSLLQFPPLTQDAVRRDFDARCTALQRLACLPPMAAEPYAALAAACSQQQLEGLLLHGPEQQQQQAGQPEAGADAPASLSQGTAVLGSAAFDARARMLALCGWDLKLMTAAMPPAGGDGSQQQQQQAEDAGLPAVVGPESAALQCSLCSAKAGLWTFFPQCKPVVLQPPARRRGGGGTLTSPTAAVAKAAVSRNVAADIATTIAGGSMQAAPGAAAAPFGSGGQQAPAFGAAQQASDGGEGSVEADGAAAQQPLAAPAPFGGGSSASMPVFGFAALQSSKPEAQAGAAAGAANGSHAQVDRGQKRKQPDFSWSAIMADIDAKAAAEKRDKAAAAAAGGGGTAEAAAAGRAAGPADGRGAPPSRQQRLAAAGVAAAKYAAAESSALDPLALHRAFCPWVNATQAGDKEGRCGWRWCLRQLAASAAPAAPDAGGPAEEEGEGASRDWDPAQLLRSVLNKVDVHK
ncbi:Nuclear-interacting partner of ALK [Chlorella sorokiniana]|uniref:Nuclear-interacting partner of ALK n=1 Tax=Chlorella sorokiniana TaxID=3076 RepID=A0A2P6TR85_CHLSO|nr:Nuclear-interacting partner of ALK [Chlorella sorokiniana]|eukprot:PRW56570.1 Nuclear-interacting partner of ALK [Chlorella sorokiniana]